MSRPACGSRRPEEEAEHPSHHYDTHQTHAGKSHTARHSSWLDRTITCIRRGWYCLLTSWSQAEACRSVGMAMRKCPSGMYAEIKYDGERVQVHKQGSHFEYFSRSLKPVLGHKVHVHPSIFLPPSLPPSVYTPPSLPLIPLPR